MITRKADESQYLLDNCYRVLWLRGVHPLLLHHWQLDAQLGSVAQNKEPNRIFPTFTCVRNLVSKAPKRRNKANTWISRSNTRGGIEGGFGHESMSPHSSVPETRSEHSRQMHIRTHHCSTSQQWLPTSTRMTRCTVNQ